MYDMYALYTCALDICINTECMCVCFGFRIDGICGSVYPVEQH